MNITFKNLGPLEHGTIDLNKKINVLVGENGTGKTYVSAAIYALLTGGKECSHDYNNYIKELLEHKVVTINLYKEINNFLEACDKPFNNWLKRFASALSMSDLERKGLLQNILGNPQIENGEEYNTAFLKKEVLMKKIDTDIILSGIGINIKKAKASHEIRLSLLEDAITDSSQKEQEDAIIMEADLYDTIIKYPIKDVLPLFHKKDDYASMLHHNENKRSKYYKIGRMIETKMLHGTFGANNNTAVFYVNDKKSNCIPIKATSSMVRCLSSLVVFLKYQAKDGDIIIIDEPEEGLFADMQIKLTRIFASLANMGLRFIISTHSDYIIREFNNLIMMSHKDEKIVKKFLKKDYKESEYIKSSDIAFNLFTFEDKKSRKSIMTAIKGDELGYDIKIIDDVIRNQNIVSEDLFYGIKGDHA